MKFPTCLISVFSLVIFVSQVGYAEIDKHSGMTIPSMLGGLTKSRLIDNESEHPGLGISVYYGAPRIKATVYIYTLGNQHIPDGIQSQAILDAFEAAKAEIEQVSQMGFYKLTSPITASPAIRGIIASDKARLTALMAVFTYEDQGQEYDSELYMFGSNNQIVKLRISYLVSDREKLFQLYNGFFEAVADWLSSDTLQLASVGVSVPIPKGYIVVPESEWKAELTLAQQFIVSQPTDFNYVIQKAPDGGRWVVPFETSHFLLKYKAHRDISYEQFKSYVRKYFLNWDEVFKERQRQGLVSNLARSSVLEAPTVDYEKKTVIFKSFFELGDVIKRKQFMYSLFTSSGNLIVVFIPLSKADETDFDSMILNISSEVR